MLIGRRGHFPLRQETRLVSFDHYSFELQNQLREASKRGASFIIVTASELNLAVGGSGQFINNCFEALQSEIGPNDEVLVDTESGNDLAVRFSLPRSSD